MYEFVVSPEQAGKPLRVLLQSELHMSRRLLRRLIQSNGVLRNGQPAKLIQPAQAGDQISVRLPEEVSEVPPEPMPLDVRYEDDEVLVVNKPPGRLTHPSSKERTGSLLAGVRAYLGPEAAPHSVHRLDRNTSGLIMFAKHAHAHHLYDKTLRQGRLHRVYWALVWCAESPPSGGDCAADVDGERTSGDWRVIDLPIATDPSKPSRRCIDAAGQRAVTHYRVVASRSVEEFAVQLVQIVLETGRTHQIRLHMASIGRPLVGDEDYDASYSQVPLPTRLDEVAATLLSETVGQPLQRQALHAAQLAWTHPVTGEAHVVCAEPPDDMYQLWQRIGGNTTVFEQLLHDRTAVQRLEQMKHSAEEE